MLMCRGGHKFFNPVWTSLKASMMTMTLVSFPQGTGTWDTPTSLAVLPFGLTFPSLVTAVWTTLLTCKMYWVGAGGFLSQIKLFCCTTIQWGGPDLLISLLSLHFASPWETSTSRECWPQPQVFRAKFFNSCNIQGNSQAFQLTGQLWWQKLSLSF